MVFKSLALLSYSKLGCLGGLNPSVTVCLSPFPHPPNTPSPLFWQGTKKAELTEKMGASSGMPEGHPLFSHDAAQRTVTSAFFSPNFHQHLADPGPLRPLFSPAA